MGLVAYEGWLIPHNSKGPYTAEPVGPYGLWRVLGSEGHQLHTAQGAVLQASAIAAKVLADLANRGEVPIG